MTRFGIASLSDLIRFDHTKFWDKNVLLYKLPTSAKLGTLLGTLRDARTDVKAGALTKRAREWKLDHSLKMDHSDDTVFVLHNALLSERQSLEKSVYKMIMKMFAPISFSAWERKTMLHLQKSQHMRALI